MNRGRCLALVILSSTIQSAVGAPLLRTVALSGQQAPGAPSGVVFADVGSSVSINSTGQVGFLSTLSIGVGGVTTNNDRGIWSEIGGSLQLVAREGSQAPGGPLGANIDTIYSASFDSVGEVAFSGLLQIGTAGVTAVNNSALWHHVSGSLEIIAREGGQAPGLPAGAVFSELLELRHNDAGEVAFPAVLKVGAGGVTSSNATTLWSQSGGTLHVVNRSGTQAPGTLPGTLFEQLERPEGTPILFNQNGHLAFMSTLRDGTGDVNNSNNRGIWSDRSGSLELVLRAGDQVPGLSPGTRFTGSSFFSGNSSGQVAFLGSIIPSGADPNDQQTGIWAEGDTGFKPVARHGDPAPGAAPGALFQIYGVGDLNWMAFNDLGQVAFTSYLAGAGGQNQGIWSGTPEDVQLVALRGNPAPGASGATFDYIDAIALNNAGQVGFSAYLDDGRVGIWAQDRSGILQVIAVSGQEIEVAPGDIRTLTAADSFAYWGNNDGLPIKFNDRGQIVFRGYFDDDSVGYFVSYAVAVPEPSAILLMALVIAGNFARRVR